MSSRATNAEVRSYFIRRALLWFLPALLLLPVALLIIAVSMVAADGSLLEIGTGFKGKLLTALGPLLLCCGLVIGIGGVLLGPTLLADWLWVVGSSGSCIVLGYAAIKISLKAIRNELSG